MDAIEFLKSLIPAGMLSHKLTLKKLVPIMFLRNLDLPKEGSGKCLIDRQIHPQFLGGKILTRQGKKANKFIPRIRLIPALMAFEFKRPQLPAS